VFAGISLDGATLRPDKDSNAELYGGELTNQEIVMAKSKAPAAASALIAELNKYSRHKE